MARLQMHMQRQIGHRYGRANYPSKMDGHWHPLLAATPPCYWYGTSTLPEEDWSHLTLTLLPLDLVLPKESPGSFALKLLELL